MCEIDSISFIKEFYTTLFHTKLSSEYPTITKVMNPLKNTEEECYLVNNKKHSFYKYIYDPSKIMQNQIDFVISSDIIIDEDYKKKHLRHLSELINPEKKENCCNCVSFTLYIQDMTDDKDFIGENKMFFRETIKKLYGYLSSLQISIININKNLPDFVCRIYMDSSVIKVVNKIKNIDKSLFGEAQKWFDIHRNRIVKIIKFIYESDNVEIYTYICKSFETSLEKTRSLRFLPLADTEVNIKIIREADGIVTVLDCHNINLFEKSNKLMMTYNILNKSTSPNFLNYDTTSYLTNRIENKIPEKKHFIVNIVPYSIWLGMYTKNISYFSRNKSLFDILAGDIGFSIQINPEIYAQNLSKFNENYSIVRENSQGNYMALTAGYDEMFLLELFKNIICHEFYDFEINNFKIDMDKLSNTTIANICLILNNVYYPKKHIIIDELDVLDKLDMLSIVDSQIQQHTETTYLYDYLFDSQLKKLITMNIVPDEMLSINNMLLLLNEMPYKNHNENIVLYIYTYSDDEKLYKQKYLKYKQKYLKYKQKYFK